MDVIRYGWLAVILFSVLIEAATVTLASIWFAFGGLVALICTLFISSLPVLIMIFFIVSIVLLIFTRPIAVKYLKIGRYKTNTDLLIGKECIVIEDINTIENKGLVKIGGQTWSAKTSLDYVIKKDEMVVIKKVEGVKLVVERANV